MPHLQIHSRSHDGKLVPAANMTAGVREARVRRGEAGSVDLFATLKEAFAAVCAAAVLAGSTARPPWRCRVGPL
jgi:hypothetical protein